MLKRLRQALDQLGGTQTLIAISAVAWGLHRLQQIAEERQAHLDNLAAEIDARTSQLTTPDDTTAAAPCDPNPADDGQVKRPRSRCDAGPSPLNTRCAKVRDHSGMHCDADGWSWGSLPGEPAPDPET